MQQRWKQKSYVESGGEMIIVRPMRQEDKQQVEDLVRGAMRKHYYCEPYELPELMFAASRSDVVVGAIGIFLGGSERLPLEKSYALDYQSFPEVFERSKTVQIGRWVATAPNISEALLYIAIRHAYQNGYSWGIGEIKPKVLRYFARLGMRVVTLRGLAIVHNVPAAIRPYYLLPPQPIPCVIHLEDALAVLKEPINKLVIHGRVVMYDS